MNTPELKPQPKPTPSASSSLPPSPSPTQLAAELLRLSALLDSTARERDQARAELAQAITSLIEFERALNADELIELRPQLWIRPSTIRDVETSAVEPATDRKPESQNLIINGEERLTVNETPARIAILLAKILPHLSSQK